MTRVRRLILTDFRSYVRAELTLDGRPVCLFGPNGVGKTNLLEAVSLLAPGRGLRNLSQRAGQLGGTFEVDAEPGRGTLVRWTAKRQA